MLTPCAAFNHLGLSDNLRKRNFSALIAKVNKLRQQALLLAQFAAQHRRFVKKKQLAKFIGSAISLSPAIPAARFKLLPLYDSLNTDQSWSKHVDVCLSNGAYRSLRYFLTQLEHADCKVWWEATAPEEMLYTDSSDYGLGAHQQEAKLD